jgi:hypothetical protein
LENIRRPDYPILERATGIIRMQGKGKFRKNSVSRSVAGGGKVALGLYLGDKFLRECGAN